MVRADTWRMELLNSRRNLETLWNLKVQYRGTYLEAAESYIYQY
jgi:hypothetical protein